jgi:hypothetical protein
MTEEKEEDLDWLQEEHYIRLDKKYRAGDRKHGDDLLTLTLTQYLEEAIEENLDQYVYLMKALKEAKCLENKNES